MADYTVPSTLLDQATKKGKEAYSKLVAGGEDRVTSAEQAAEVVVANVDKGLAKDVPLDVVEAAEAASVVASNAVSDFPTDEKAAKREAANGIRQVSTAESVAAAGAQRAVDSAMGSEVTGKQLEGQVAVNAAIDTIETQRAVRPEIRKKAEAKAMKVFMDMIERFPEQEAAREAAKVAIREVYRNAPELLKHSGEAAAESAAVAERDHPGDQIAVKKEATKLAEELAFTDKLATKAATEAVTEVEDSKSLRGAGKNEKEAEAAGVAAAVALQDVADVSKKDAVKAENKAAKAFQEALDKSDTKLQAAEKAAEAAIATISADGKKELSDVDKEVAESAAVSAVNAVEQHPTDAVLAVEKVGSETADAVDRVRLDDSINMSASKKIPLIIMAAVALTMVYFAWQRIAAKRKYSIPSEPLISEDAWDIPMKEGSLRSPADMGYGQVGSNYGQTDYGRF
eukprot:TRINITY_DN22794_c0_g1_i1.p1 TRINITY_DN22794_c0_g1~~TRINITY_DN22794_c0_g1_i1.p1  ORF type:complete len:535 (+),score=149.01 TRINITY_DN22794_c0_g1_i1:239-1606(+)